MITSARALAVACLVGSKIEVETKLKGVTVRARRGYFDDVRK